MKYLKRKHAISFKQTLKSRLDCRLNSSISAHGARFVTSMPEFVPEQSPVKTKANITFSTLVWLLPSMYTKMARQLTFGFEGFSTFTTDAWFFSRMDTPVFNKIAFVLKAFLTFATVE